MTGEKQNPLLADLSRGVKTPYDPTPPIHAQRHKIFISIDGVEFTIDARNADPNIIEEIARLVKGFFTVLQRQR